MAATLSASNPGTATLRPSAPPTEAGILHLGLGNFHRAHQAVYTAAALDSEPGPWGIVGAANSSRRVVAALRAQDGRYSVLTLQPEGVRADVMAVHTDSLVATEEPEALLNHLADRRIQVVTLTVTEHGYGYSSRTGKLDAAQTDVANDLAGGAPMSTIGRLARGLQRRFRTGGAPISVISCDNLQHNGQQTQALVRQFIELADEPEAADLLAWLEDSVTFPSTMVDRIVPATEDVHRERALELLGVADDVPVPAEPFSMWVLEDRFATDRPRWEAGGAILTDDVTSYELLKLRVLNASNSMLAYLGLLGGRRYIAEALDLPSVRDVVQRLMHDEMLPTLQVPDAIDIDRYVGQLFERFGNLAVGHRTAQVGSDGSLKLPVRITEPVAHHLDRGGAPGAIALLTAAFIRCLTAPDEAYPADVTGHPADPRADELAALGRTVASSQALVEAVFERTDIFPATLSQATSFVDRVSEVHDALVRDGLEAGILEIER